MPVAAQDHGDGDSAAVPGGPPVLVTDGLTKSFFGTAALRDGSLEIVPGEIHALLGENGAGKSTLIKILAGVYQRDGGRVVVAGEELPARISPAQVSDLGVAFIHQDLALVQDASIAENIAIVAGYPKRGGLISLRQMRTDAAARLEAVGSHLDPAAAVGDLNSADKALVAIARALVGGARLVVLDEPTARLRRPEVDHLFEQLRNLKRRGASFLFVTHRLGEVFELADRATVLRDGCTVATRTVAEVTEAELIEDIVGRDLGELFPERRSNASGDPVLSVRDLATPHVEGVSFDVRPGEIVGLAGLVSGAPTSVARAAFGVEEIIAGEVLVDGRPLLRGSYPTRIGEIAYVPGDRHKEGLALDLTVRENILLEQTVLSRERRGRLGRFAPKWLPGGEDASAGAAIADFQIQPPVAEGPVATLSGGNQQKVLLAKWIITRPRLLILEEPTAGVDIGTKTEIYRIVARLAEQGTAILLVSADFEEVASVAHRVLVIRGGRIGAELGRDELTRERLATESYRVA